MGSYGLKNHSWFKQGSSLNKFLGHGIEGWGKENILRNLAYGGAGAGITAGVLYSGLFPKMSNKDKLFLIASGFGLGIGARKLPQVSFWALDLAGDSAMLWGAKKGALDPLIGRAEYWLDNAKDAKGFDWEAKSWPFVHKKHPVMEHHSIIEEIPRGR